MIHKKRNEEIIEDLKYIEKKFQKEYMQITLKQ